MSDNQLSAFYQRQDILGESYNPAQALRFTEVPTFMRTPMVSNLHGVDIGIIGVPYDGGLTCRTGARYGPREVRNQSSLMRAINVATGCRPFELARVGDLGDVRFRDIFSLDRAIDDIERYFVAIADTQVLPLAVGGDHSVTYPILKAMARRYNTPLGLLHIDAHTDTWPAFAGSKFHHGAPFRLATDEGLIDPDRTVQIGIRGGQNFADGLDYSRDHGMRVITIEEFDDLGWKAVAQEARRLVGDAPTYLTFDVDGLDPVFTPGTGTPEAGGITMREAQRLLREFHSVNLIGGDVVEVSPPLDPSGVTALNAATILFEMLCVLVEAFRRVG
ncbi:MAG: agmatinase [Gammaproteobacteria bacterium]|nr:agmatinase [Gammaproteobacteria bacterium]